MLLLHILLRTSAIRYINFFYPNHNIILITYLYSPSLLWNRPPISKNKSSLNSYISHHKQIQFIIIYSYINQIFMYYYIIYDDVFLYYYLLNHIFLPHLLQVIPSSYWTLICIAILSLTVAWCDFCSSNQRFASTFLQIPPRNGHTWSWLYPSHYYGGLGTFTH